jgi:hypothetical protein
MPSRDRVGDSNHYYPTSIAMLSQCLQIGYKVSPQVMQKTIDSVIEMVSQYSNLTNTFLNSLIKIQTNVLSGYGNLYVPLRAPQCTPPPPCLGCVTLPVQVRSRN